MVRKECFQSVNPPALPKVETWLSNGSTTFNGLKPPPKDNFDGSKWGIGSQGAFESTRRTTASPDDSSIPTYSFHWGPDSEYSTKLTIGIVREKQLKDILEKAGIEYPPRSAEDLPSDPSSVLFQSSAQDHYVSKLDKVYIEKRIPLPPKPRLELWTESQPSHDLAGFYPNGESPWDDITAGKVAKIEEYRDAYEQQGATYPPFEPEPLPTFPSGEGRMEGTYWNYLQIQEYLTLLIDDFHSYKKPDGRGLGSLPERSTAQAKGNGTLTLKRRGITI